MNNAYNTSTGRQNTLGALSGSNGIEANGIDSENKEEQLARREREELERQARITSKINILKEQDSVITRALQHRRRDIREQEIRKMAENWSEEMKRYDELKRSSQ